MNILLEALVGPYKMRKQSEPLKNPKSDNVKANIKPYQHKGKGTRRSRKAKKKELRNSSENEIMNNIIDAFKYRDCPVIISFDDYGQSYQYEIYDRGQKVFSGGCGTYNPDYRAEVESVIDDFFDHIHNYPKWHGSTKFLNHEHTIIGLYYCGELVVTYDVTPIHSVEAILQIAARELKSRYEKDFGAKK